jgi:hypothetical protein
MRSAYVNQHLSAQEFVFGIFNFDATPLAPPGTKVLIHEKPTVRESWVTHGVGVPVPVPVPIPIPIPIPIPAATLPFSIPAYI